MDEFLCGARAMAPELIQMRRALHGMAEVGMWLPRTQAYVAQRLADMGCAVDEFPGGGMCARIGPEGGGPAFCSGHGPDCPGFCPGGVAGRRAPHFL